MQPEEIEARLNRQDLDRVLSNFLHDVHYKRFFMRYGLCGYEEHTVEEICKLHKRSRARIYQSLHRTERKLKANPTVGFLIGRYHTQPTKKLQGVIFAKPHQPEPLPEESKPYWHTDVVWYATRRDYRIGKLVNDEDDRIIELATGTPPTFHVFLKRDVVKIWPK